MERKMLSVYVPPIWTGVFPKGFTKLLRPVVGFLRSRGMRCVVYIDDLLLLHQDKQKLREFSATALVLLESLGFLINYPKSVLGPTQTLVFRGFIINSVEKELSLPAEKLEKIVVEAKTMLKCHTVSARSLAQLIGRITAAILAVHPAPLHYRGLQHLKHLALRRKGYDGQVTLSLGARKPAMVGEKPSHLEWESSSRGEPRCSDRDRYLKNRLGSLLPGNPDGRLLECSGSGITHKFPGNVSSILCNQSVHQELSGDLSFTVYGHVHSDLCQPNWGERSPLLTAQAIGLWSWCLQRKITVAAQYIPRLESVTADYLSRHLRDRTEPTIFNCVNSQLGPLQEDLFATRFSKQPPRFFSWQLDPEAEATDAFAQSWTNIQGFAHPPWCLIS